MTTSPAQPLLGEQERNATVAAYAEPLAGTIGRDPRQRTTAGDMTTAGRSGAHAGLGHRDGALEAGALTQPPEIGEQPRVLAGSNSEP